MAANDGSPAPVISVDGLTKVYRVERRKKGRMAWLRSFLAPTFEDLRALDGVSFTLGRGEIVGLLGPNGAGKSTTVKIMSGIIYPTAGTVRVLGRDPQRQRIQNAQEIGVLFGNRSHLIYELPAIDSFRFLRAVYQITHEEFDDQVARLTRVLEIEPLLQQPVRTLSLGQRMRCEVAATFLHRPRVVYLDEPTIGLDVNAKRHIRRFIRSMADELGTTIILTTHDLADIEELCERVILIDRGRILYDGGLRRLRSRYAHSKAVQVEVVTDERERVTLAVTAVTGDVAALIDVAGTQLRVTGIEDERRVLEVAKTLLDQPGVSNLTITEPRVEEIIRNVFQESAASESHTR